MKLALLFLSTISLSYAVVVPKMLAAADCFDGVDLVFAIDSSETFFLSFEQAKAHMKNIVDSLTIGTGHGQSQVAIYNFDNPDPDTVNPVLKFADCKDIACVDNVIENHEFTKTGRKDNFVQGIDYAIKNMFAGARGYPHGKILAFISDGYTDELTDSLIAARDRAETQGIHIFFFYFVKDHSTRTIDALVGDDELHEHSYPLDGPDAFKDPTLFQPCHHPAEGVCYFGGIPSCICPEGYVQPHCRPENVCKNKTYDVCHNHGVCNYDINTGSWCNCTEPWTGRWCDTTHDAAPLERCLKYNTTYTMKDLSDSSITRYPCDLTKERCVPDNVDCAMNVPSKKTCDKDGKNCVYTCDKGGDHTSDGHCKCYYPIGWCEPLEPGNGHGNNGPVNEFFKAIVKRLES